MVGIENDRHAVGLGGRIDEMSTGNTARTPVAAISPHFTPETERYIITEVGTVLA